MSLTALLKEAGVSNEDITASEPLVQETVVSPVDSPSAAIPVVDAVVETAPVVEPVPETVAAPVTAPLEPAVVESVVAPVAEAPLPVEAVAVDQVIPTIPVVEAQAAVAEAVEITQIEATACQVEAEQQAIKDKADELLDMQTALENLTSIIRKTGANGVSNQTAEVIQSQLRSINRRLGVESKFVSTESFIARDNREQHAIATIALEDIKTSVKVAKNKFIELLEKILALFKRAASNWLDGLVSLDKKVDQLDQRLGALKKPGGGGSLTLHNAGLVVYKDSIDIPEDIPGLAHFASVAYPDVVTKYLDQSAKTLLKYKPSDFDPERIKEEFERHAKPLAYLIELQVEKDELPGGQHLDVDEGGLSFGIKGEVPAGVDKEVDLETTVELRKKVRAIKDIVEQIKKIRPEVEKIDKAGKRLIEAARRSTSLKAEDEKEAEDFYNIVHDAISRSAAAKPRVDEVIKYLVRYLGAQVAIVNTMADAIEKEKED
ncbi:internal head protein [Pseudomonas phage 201phi2-1]|uniref:Virion structural protein n=1 Tax=Pseudomonas phage 201phi2-1 TaxID=198110 RepID=B3FJ20_BP201|nr:internal head protein [Pseudomonas phage 201phi2-1]ABY62987.1 virion structural protein [Pseudomonas phage 201phi2-1]